MPWFPKSFSRAASEGDAVYDPGAKGAIKSFVENHDGSAGRAGIMAYMAEMYGTSEACVRVHLSQLVRDGALQQDGDSYVSEYTGADWI